MKHVHIKTNRKKNVGECVWVCMFMSVIRKITKIHTFTFWVKMQKRMLLCGKFVS